MAHSFPEIVIKIETLLTRLYFFSHVATSKAKFKLKTSPGDKRLRRVPKGSDLYFHSFRAAAI